MYGAGVDVAASENHRIPVLAAGSSRLTGSRRRSEHTVHVLLVEDNLGDAHLAELNLADAEEPSFTTTTVQTLNEALSVLAVARPDVVLTDLGLPDAIGAETVRRLRRAHPSLPIVVFTGADVDDGGTVAIRTGADDYLRKDELTSGMLARTLRHAIERRRTERALVAHVADGVVVLDDEGEVRFANAVAAELLGRSEAELLGQRLELPSPWTTGDEIDLRAPSGAVRTLEVRSSDIEWYDRPATVLTLHDVTELRRADELRLQLERAERLAAMGHLAASIAHEVNNALAVLAIRLPALRSAAKRLGPDPVTQAAFADSELAVGRITGIVRQMSDYARYDSVDIQAVDINEIVGDAIRLVGPVVRQRARLQQSLGAVPRIAADAGQFTQIVVNLVLNAADAVEPKGGAGVVEITTAAVDDGVAIAVSDNGTGVPDAIREQIFDPFFTTKPRGHGTGLGLAVVADLVRARGGRVEVASPPGGGARFEVWLPVGELPAIAIPQARRGARATATLSDARVLVIDDDRAVRTALARLLRSARTVREAGGGAEALAELERDAGVDAIVCDLMMPGMDGAAFYQQLAARFPSLAARVVFVTGGATSERTRRLLASGVRHVSKPLERGALESAIEDVLATRDP